MRRVARSRIIRSAIIFFYFIYFFLFVRRSVSDCKCACALVIVYLIMYISFFFFILLSFPFGVVVLNSRWSSTHDRISCVAHKTMTAKLYIRAGQQQHKRERENMRMRERRASRHAQAHTTLYAPVLMAHTALRCAIISIIIILLLFALARRILIYLDFILMFFFILFSSVLVFGPKLKPTTALRCTDEHMDSKIVWIRFFIFRAVRFGRSTCVCFDCLNTILIFCWQRDRTCILIVETKKWSKRRTGDDTSCSFTMMFNESAEEPVDEAILFWATHWLRLLRFSLFTFKKWIFYGSHSLLSTQASCISMKDTQIWTKNLCVEWDTHTHTNTKWVQL